MSAHAAPPVVPGGTAAGQGAFLFWLSLAQLISWGSTFYLFGLIVLPMEAHLGMDRALSSVGISLTLLVEGAAAWFMGRWIDRGHARVVMTAGSILAGALLVAHSQVSSVAGFLLIWALMGLAFAATLYMPAFAVVTRRFPLDYRRAIITITFLGGLASTVFIPLISWLLSRFGWSATLGLLALLHWAVCAPIHALLLQDEPREPVSAGPQDDEADAGRPAVRELAAHPAFWLIGLFSALGLAITSGVPPHLIALLRERGLSDTWVVLVPASIGVLQVFGRLVVFALDERWNVHRVNLAITLLMPFAFVILLLAGSSPWMALLFATVFGLANGTMTIVKGTAIATYVSRHHVAALNGLLGLPQAVARAATPALIGAMWSASHGYLWGVVTLLGISLVACAAFALAQRRALGVTGAPGGGA